MRRPRRWLVAGLARENSERAASLFRPPAGARINSFGLGTRVLERASPIRAVPTARSRITGPTPAGPGMRPGPAARYGAVTAVPQPLDAAKIVAMIPARIASGSRSHAATTAASRESDGSVHTP
jgi:hypothetical protein